MVKIINLVKSFSGQKVLDGINLEMPTGQITVVIGKSGVGKSVLLKHIVGLLKPDSGSGTCLGYDIRRQSADIKRNVGYMTPRFSFWDDLTIRENLDFVARMYQLPNRREAVQKSLEDLGLASRARQLAGELSGGWKQRMALAACMLHNPMLLLLDEPTAGVDPKARRDFWDELQGLAARGVSVLVSTHYMDEAVRCHKLAYIAYGRLLAQGSAAEVVASQRLSSWAIFGDHLVQLQDALRQQPGVEQTVSFGTLLHVSGTDAALLQRTIDATVAAKGVRAEKIDTGLEDVFIYMMSRSADNFGGQA